MPFIRLKQVTDDTAAVALELSRCPGEPSRCLGTNGSSSPARDSEASNPFPGVRPCRLKGPRLRWRVGHSAHVTGPFADPEGPHLTCPVMRHPSPALQVTHPTHVSGLSARASGPIHRVMDSPCLSAGGICFLGHLVPAADLGRPSEDRPAYWPGGQTTTGLPRSAPDELRRGRAPSLLRGRGVYDRSKARSRSRGPYHRISHPAAISAYAASMKVHLRSPFPSFPGPVHPDGSGSPWALPACCRTLRYLALARVGNRQRHISGSWRLSPRPLIRSDIRVALPYAKSLPLFRLEMVHIMPR